MRLAILGHVVAAWAAIGLGAWALAALAGWWLAGPPAAVLAVAVAGLGGFALGALPRRPPRMTHTTSAPGAA
jgi:hypothetical protein